MREILFRGKSEEKFRRKQEWIYGSLAVVEKHDHSGPEHIIVEYFENGGSINVSPDTVSQYTGLKDKNGKKIFEGDIISVPGSKKQGLPAPVSYMDAFHNPEFVIRRNGYNPICLTDVEEWGEVVGNIWDNPDLLEAAHE